MKANFVKLHDLLDKFQQFIQSNNLITPSDRILIAVSGGKDSVALLDLMCRYFAADRSRLGVVYIDHDWDPERHEKEAAFVSNLCCRYSVKYHREKIDHQPTKQPRSVSIESLAREERYHLFAKVLSKGNYHLCATGHTLDDQAETILMRLLRGSGLWGLSGIPVKRGYYIRPMLTFHSDEITSYLNNRNIKWLEDPTNRDRKFLRTRLRHELIPRLEQEFNPEIKKAVVALGNDISQWRQEITKHFPSPIYEEKGKIMLAESVFFSYLDIIRKFWLQEALQVATGCSISLRRYHLRQVSNLSGDGKTGKWVELPNRIRLLRDRDRLILVPETAPKPESQQVGIGNYTCEPLGVEFQAREVPKETVEYLPDPFVEWMDLDMLPEPWTLRPWQPGDRFHPLGTAGTRKISNFLVDKKIPRCDKDRVLVLEVSGKIAWLVGNRIDHHTRITENTNRIVQLNITQLET